MKLKSIYRYWGCWQLGLQGCRVTSCSYVTPGNQNVNYGLRIII